MKRINLKQVNWMKALKIAGGGVAAILLAEALGLQNAASAGIITLLTVQNTRRETVMSSVRRFAGFGIMTLLSLPIYHFCGTAPWSFGIVLLLLLLLCYAFRMDDATPINAVMATHYMFAGGVSIGMVGNEILLLVDVSDTEERAKARRDEFVRTVLADGRYDGYKMGVVTFGFTQNYAVPLTYKVDDIYDMYKAAELRYERDEHRRRAEIRERFVRTSRKFESGADFRRTGNGRKRVFRHPRAYGTGNGGGYGADFRSVHRK